MRLKVYNPGSLNRKRINDRFDNAFVQHLAHYSAANKLKIIATVEKMMAEEYLKQNQACEVLQVHDTQVLRWQANHASLKEAARLEKQIMHKCPVGCVDAFTEELVSFLDKWHGKGILVSCLCLIRKTLDLGGKGGKSSGATKMCSLRTEKLSRNWRSKKMDWCLV
jgi:hypothetical protein